MTVFNIVHSVYLFNVIWTDMSENKLFVIVIVIVIVTSQTVFLSVYSCTINHHYGISKLPCKINQHE